MSERYVGDWSWCAAARAMGLATMAAWRVVTLQMVTVRARMLLLLLALAWLLDVLGSQSG